MAAAHPPSTVAAAAAPTASVSHSLQQQQEQQQQQQQEEEQRQHEKKPGADAGGVLHGRGGSVGTSDSDAVEPMTPSRHMPLSKASPTQPRSGAQHPALRRQQVQQQSPVTQGQPQAPVASAAEQHSEAGTAGQGAEVSAAAAQEQPTASAVPVKPTTADADLASLGSAGQQALMPAQLPQQRQGQLDGAFAAAEGDVSDEAQSLPSDDMDADVGVAGELTM